MLYRNEKLHPKPFLIALSALDKKFIYIRK